MLSVNPNTTVLKVMIFIFEDIKGISSAQIHALSDADIETAADFLNADAGDLLEIKGIGEKTFEKIEKLISDAVEVNEVQMLSLILIITVKMKKFYLRLMTKMNK